MIRWCACAICWITRVRPCEWFKGRPAKSWTMIDSRNRLIHGYDFVDYDILWGTIMQDLPPLIDALEKLVPPEKI